MMTKRQYIGIWTCRQQFRYSRGGCGRKNVYASNYRESVPKVVDACCRRCNRRVKFQPTRIEKRGRRRAVSFIWLDSNIDIDAAFRIRDEYQWNQRDYFHQSVLPGTFGFEED